MAIRYVAVNKNYKKEIHGVMTFFRLGVETFRRLNGSCFKKKKRLDALTAINYIAVNKNYKRNTSCNDHSTV